MTDLIYPEHKHPHGINNLQPNEYRIWVCEECGHTFTDGEIREDESKGWGHCCKLHPCLKGQRCESHLEPYVPDETGGKQMTCPLKLDATHCPSCAFNQNGKCEYERMVKK